MYNYILYKFIYFIDMEKENNIGMMDPSMKDTGEIIWPTVKVD